MSGKGIEEIHYTICPVGNASYIAARKGWLAEGLSRIGVRPVLLQSLPKSQWAAHFNYQDDVLFREGGNIPPLWAKSNGAKVVLIGLALLKERQCIIARANSPVERVEQLRGRRIAIPAHPAALIDFHRASAEHGFQLALCARGVDVSEAESVIISSKGDFISSAQRGHEENYPNGPWASSQGTGSESAQEADEIAALDAGDADAVFVKLSKLQGLMDTGKYKILYEISANPRLLLPINNEYPNTLTVSQYLAEKHPEVVTAFVKQVLLAARWARDNRAEATEILAEQTLGTIGQFIGSNASDYHEHLTPNFSQDSLAALEGQKKFLYDKGYLKNDFAIDKWADDHFLRAAWKEIQAEDEKRAAGHAA